MGVVKNKKVGFSTLRIGREGGTSRRQKTIARGVIVRVRGTITGLLISKKGSKARGFGDVIVRLPLGGRRFGKKERTNLE